MPDNNDNNDISPENFHNILPRTIFAESNTERLDKEGNTFTGLQGLSSTVSQVATFGASNQIMRNPSRRFYDPEITTTAVYLPRTVKQKNRWCRWFYDHDELIGSVLDLHAELPYSRAEIVVSDPHILRHIEDCFDQTNFFSMLPSIDLEFMKIGEVFVHTPWDDAKGMWSHIILHNPDFAEVTFTPFADQECAIELIPDDELKALVHSTKPEQQQLKRRIPQDVFRRVLTGKNITLDPEEVTHIARRSNPYDIRGTSLISRIFRLLMYEDKLREAQITIADNFVYPLKIFKLGDPQKGWIPNETHQRALAQMLQQSTFDPNFSLIYHYGLQVEYVTVADKVMRLEKEWSDIAEKKMVALGVSKQFLTGDSTYSSANVGLQTQLARYKAKRDLFEFRWMREKFFRIMAERNGWYRRDKKELVGQYRVKRKGTELEERLILPQLVWHKKLMMRDDQAFLTFLNNVYAQGKGPLSAITLLQGMGLSLEDELENKTKQDKLEAQIGAFIHTPMGGPAPMGGLTAKIKEKFTRKKEGKGDKEETEDVVQKSQGQEEDRMFTGATAPETKVISAKDLYEKEAEDTIETTKILNPVDDNTWFTNIESPAIPGEVKMLLLNLNSKLGAIEKKSNGNFAESIKNETTEIMKPLLDIYKQGKLHSYNITGFLPIYQQYYASGKTLTEYSDLELANEFESWVKAISNIDIEKVALIRHMRNLGNSCFSYGQLKGFQEQGVYSVKVGNVLMHDGLKYTTTELLHKGWNLSSLISPKDEIIMYSPCIEGYDDEEFGNNLDPNIDRYRNLRIAGIAVDDCPIEYVYYVSNFVNKLSSYLGKRFSHIKFVKDIIDLEEWETLRRKELEKQYADIESEGRNAMVLSTLSYEKVQKRGMVPILEDGKTLYVSNWIGMEDSPLTNSLLKYINVVGDHNEKQIRKAFKQGSLDLSPEELQTYRIFKYIETISDSPEDPRGYRLSVEAEKKEDVDYKLKQGKMWDLSGKCLTGSDVDEIKMFQDNLRLWLDYPHLLSANIKKSFEVLT